MVSRQWSRSILALSAVLYLSQASCGQQLVSPVRKDEALKKVQVRSIPGWREVTSVEGHFRILFPRQPEIDENVKSMKGFRLADSDKNWFAFYTEYEKPRLNDETNLRESYRNSTETIIKKNQSRSQPPRLLSQRDVFLHGRLGTEFVIETAETVSYMRAFSFDRRMYTLAVDVMRSADGDPTLPNDVQKYFESFTYWDVH